MYKRLAIMVAGIALLSVVVSTVTPAESVAPTKPLVVRDSQQATTTSTSTTTTVEVAPPPVPSTTTTTIPTGDWNCPEWMSLALEAGWSVEELPRLDKTMFRESTCRNDAHNPNDPGTGSYGLMQINGAAWCDGSKYYPNGWLQDQSILYTCTDLYDPLTNLRAALAIWQRSGWSPW